MQKLGGKTGAGFRRRQVGVLSVSVFILMITSALPAQAAVKYWIGPPGGSFGANANWSTTSGGGNDTTLPGASDVATFDSGGTNNCTIDTSPNVSGINILAGYTGIITQNNTQTITVGAGNYSQADGTFTGGNSTIDLNGTFTLSGGTFTATSGNINSSFDFTVSGGTFTHNNGTLKFDGATGRAVDVSTSLQLYNLEIAKNNNGETITIATGDTLVVNGNLSLSGDGKFDGGTIDIQGTITNGTAYDGGTTEFTITGAGTRSINFSNGFMTNPFTLNAANVTLNGPTTGTTTIKSLTLQNGAIVGGVGNFTINISYSQTGGSFTWGSGTFNVKGTVAVSGGTYNGGSGINDFDDTFTLSNDGTSFTATSNIMKVAKAFTHTDASTFSHNNGTVTLDSAFNATLDVNGSESFYNLTVNDTNGETKFINNNDTLVILNTLTLTNGVVSSVDIANPGHMEARGNVIVASGWDGGNADLTFTNTAAQNFDLTGGTLAFNGNVIINKASGTVTLLSNLTMDVANQSFTLTSGTLDTSSYTLRVDGATTINGGTLTATNGGLDFNGTFTQNNGILNAPSGVLTTANTFTIAGGTFNHGNGTLKFDGANARACDINTTLNLYNLEIGKVNGGETITIAAGDTLNIAGNLALTGEGKFDGGTINVTGTMTNGSIYDGGTTPINITGSGTRTINLSSGTLDSDFTVNAANLTMNGPSSSTTTLKSLTWQSGAFVGGAGSLTTNANFAQSGGSFTWDAGTFNVKGNAAVSGGTFNGGSGLNDYDGTLTISTNGTSYTATTGNTKLAKAFTHTDASTFAHNNGTVTLDSAFNATLDVNSSESFYNLTVNDSNGETKSINNNDTLVILNTLTLTNGQLSSVDTNNPGHLDARGHVIVSSTWDGGDADLTFTGTAAQNFDLTGGNGTINANIIINKPSGTVTLLSNLTMDATNQAFTLTSGIFDTSIYTLRVDGATTINGGTLTATNGVLDFNGTFTQNSGILNAPSSGAFTTANTFTIAGGTFNHNSGTLTFDGATNRTVDVATSLTLESLTINKNNGETITVTSGDTLIATGTLTCTNGAFDTGTIEAQGNVSIATTCDSGTSPLKFSGSAVQTINPSSSAGLWDGDVFVNKSAGRVDILTNNWTLNAANQDLTIEEGVFDLNGLNLTVNGTSGKIVVENGGTLQLQGGETITANGGYPQIDSGSTVSYDGGSNNNLKAYSYHHLQIIGAGTFTLPSATTVGGNLSVTAGGLALNGQNLTVSGTVSNTVTITMLGSETVTWTGDTDSGTIEFTGTGTYTKLPISNYYHLKFNAAGTWTAASALDVNGNLEIAAGTFKGGGQTINLAGNWTNSSTFTHDNSTVVMDGTNQTITGATTFYGLRKRVTAAATLTFTTGSSYTVAGPTVFQGAASNLLSLRSSVTDTQISINYQGVRVLKYLDVKDNNNTNGAAMSCAFGCVNSNGNSGWTFVSNGSPVLNQNWQFNDAASNYTFNSTYVDENVSGNGLARLKDLGGGSYAVTAPSTLPSWTRRTPVTVTSTGTQLTDFQVKVTVSYDADMQADFDDIRFTTSDGSTIINHWLESKTDSSTATYWVRVPTVPASGDTKIYMYYGNAAATSTSNIKTTFLYGDDFEDSSYTSANWTYAGTLWSVASGVLTHPTTLEGTESFASAVMNSSTSFTDGIIEVKVNPLACGNSQGKGIVSRYSNQSNLYIANIEGWVTNKLDLGRRVSGTWTKNAEDNHNCNTGSFVTLKMTLTGTSLAAAIGATSISTTDSNFASGKVGVMVDNRETAVGADFDDFRVRRYAASEPTTSIGSETTINPDITTIQPSSGGAHPTYTTLLSFTDGYGGGNAGSVRYQLGLDSNQDGTVDNWYYHTGTAWAVASDNKIHFNTATEIDTFIMLFASEIGRGKIYFRAFLASNGTQAVELDSVSISYTISNAAFSLASQSVGEATTSVNLAVTLTEDAGSNMDIPYTVSGTSTGGGTDHNLANGTLTINGGSTSANISFTVNNDTLDEDNETVIITLSNPSTNNGVLGATQVHTYTITDDDVTPSVGYSSSSSAGSEGTSPANLAVTLSAASGNTITVNYAVTGGTATGGGTDYTLNSGTLTFNPGETSKNVAITVNNDATDEVDETVIVGLSGQTNSTLGTASHTYTIQDNDAEPTLAIDNVSVNETEGNVTATFTITMTGATAKTVTVDHATANGTATSGADYTAISTTTTTFNPGETSKTINVTVLGDVLDENNETFTLGLTSPVNATITAATGTGTINDNDATPTLAFSAATSSGGENTTAVNLPVTLDAASGRTVTINYAVTGGTATGSGTDYTLASGTLTFNAGDTTKNVAITINNDALDEDDETIAVTLSGESNATLGATSVHTYTITDDDATPSLSMAPVSVTETETNVTASFTITLSAASGRAVTVTHATANGTATSGADYTAITSTVTTFNPGDTTKTVNVTVLGDALDEDDETYTLNLSSPGNATITTASATGTITDNDATPTISFNSGSQSIAENIGSASVNVTLSATSGRTVTLPFTVSGTATGGGTDHDLANGNITINAGATTGSATFNVINDSYHEVGETVILTMGSPTNATTGLTTVHTATIADNDTVGVTVTESGGSVVLAEHPSAPVTDTYTLVLTSQPAANVTITPTVDAQATLSPSTITFTTGNWNVAQTITVTPVDDLVDETSPHAGAITHAAASSDTDYNAGNVTIAGVNAQITDNETASVIVAESSGATQIAEGGSTDSYTVVLSTQPTANVAIGLTFGSQVTTSVPSLTFTSANWNTPQTVTVTAVNDARVEGLHTSVITHAGSSSDSFYNGINITIGSVTANITDNDAAGVTIIESSGSTVVTEGGSTDTYTVVLTSEPSSNITITLANDNQLLLSSSSVVFTAANWNLPQTITVAAADDGRDENILNSTITHAISTSADANYPLSLTIASVTTAITDNDAAALVLTESGGGTSITDTQLSDTYTVVLASEPTATVTVSLASTGSVTATPSSLSFTASSWNTPQTVTLTLAAAAIATTTSDTITHTITSTDTFYAALTSMGLPVTISITVEEEDDGDEGGDEQPVGPVDSVCTGTSCVETTRTSGNLLATNGETLVESTESSCDSGTCRSISFHDSTIVANASHALAAVFYGNDLIVADPNYDNDRGLVMIVPETIPAMEIDIDDVETDASLGLYVSIGTQIGDLFGAQIGTGDYDCDGIEDVLVLAAGTPYGTTSVMDGHLNQRHLIIGTSSNPISTVAAAGTGDSCGDDIIAGTASAATASLTRHSYLTTGHVVTGDAASGFIGLLSREDAASFFDLESDTPDFSLQNEFDATHMVTGFVDESDYEDIIIANDSQCKLQVFLGSAEIGSSLSLIPGNVLTCNESTPLRSIAISDLNEDGYDDIIVGFPEALDGDGRIYIFPGRHSSRWGDVNSFDDATVIDGSNGAGIGAWLITSTDQTLYTNSGEDGYQLIATGSLFVEGGDLGPATPTGNPLGGGGFGCSMQPQNQNSESFPLMLMITAVLTLALKIRYAGP